MAVVKEPLTFISPLKTRAAVYWRANPAGNYQDFLNKGGGRAHQVPKSDFEEVHLRLQKHGEIGIQEGTKSYEILMKEAEMKVRRSIDLTTPAYIPPPSPDPEDMAEAAVDSILSEQETANNKEQEVAKEIIGIKSLTSEQRLEFDKIMSVRPEIPLADLNKILGVNLKNTVFTQSKVAMRKGKWFFTNLRNSAHTKPQPSSTFKKPDTGSVSVFNPNTIITNMVIMGESIPAESWKPEERLFLRKNLPTILSLVLGKSMQFKVVEYSDLVDENEVVSLEVRRIK